MEFEKDGYVGEFMGADKRKKDGRWFKGTHFTLGGEQRTVMKSHSHVQFQPPQRVQTAPGTYDGKSMRRTHFQLGTDKDIGTTTANASYQVPGSEFAPSTLDKNTKAELRKSHLNFGGEPFGRYATTNKMDYAPKPSTAACRYDQEERKAKMRKHNFNFGKEGPDYISTHNASFQGYGKQGATNMSSKSSTDIGKTHFSLGGESAPMKTVNQTEFVEKSELSSGKSKDSIAFQQTNFKFGTDKVSQIPSSHMHYKYYGCGETGKLNREQLNELRKEHFILGKHPNQFESVSHSVHGDFGFNMENPIGDRCKTMSSSVQLGDPKLKSAFYQTTYEVSNQSRALGNNVAPIKSISKEGSHFKIGEASRPFGVSQNQATYVPLSHAASKPDMEFEK